ncbi:hypothetical protein KBP30_06060 [Streptomyces sp. Go40/10]|uniref:hypothetical protein n=1 Tax=Streptomyces sp. Go40/10 TaxID=2825844 RepID=UPI001E387171|nr:hypothetical protein [Streptomyces sp. Go40/10]UFR00765.1 hypothetical protein KBP30_06060 [Streptomyces sp. Go40/10]
MAAQASDTARWTMIDEVSDEIRSEPWSMYWREWKSDSEEFARFLREPIAVLAKEISEVEQDWTVTSTIANHHVGIGRSPICIVATSVPSERRVYLWMYKHAPDGEGA